MNNHLFYILGKSGCGKNTIYNSVIERFNDKLNAVILHTTRPIRKGEVEGKDYFFVDTETMLKDIDDKVILEMRTYKTAQGDWSYYTTKDSVDLSKGNLIGIGTIESCLNIMDAIGKENVIPIYIKVPDDGDRLLRSIVREREVKDVPVYKEVCRRFIADEDDFSPEKLNKVKPTEFLNDVLYDCITRVEDFIKSFL